VIWIVVVLVGALLLSLGCNVKQGWEITQLTAENDELADILDAWNRPATTRSTGRAYTELYDSRTKAMTAAQIAKWGMEP